MVFLASKKRRNVVAAAGSVTVAAPAWVALVRASTRSVKTMPSRTTLGAAMTVVASVGQGVGDFDDTVADGDSEVLLIVGDADPDGCADPLEPFRGRVRNRNDSRIASGGNAAAWSGAFMLRARV